MSLINRMLRDLSSRQPAAGNVMSGIQLPNAAERPRGNAFARLGVLAVLVAGFTAGLWWMFGPRPAKAPEPRSAPQDAVVASAPAPAPAAPAPQEVAPMQPAAPPTPEPAAKAPAEPARLKMDTTLSTPAAGTPAPKPKAQRPPSTPKPRGQGSRPVPSPTPEAAPAAAAPPAAPQVAAASTVRSTSKDTELYAEAHRALERGDEKAAEVALVAALELNPKLHAAREDLGTLRIRQGRLDEAESNARIGLELEPSWVGYRRLVARLELARGRPAGALEVLERDPPPVERDTEYHALLASAYQRLNRHEEASKTYQTLAQVQPEQALWWAGYAMSRDALGDVPAALAGYARARQIGGLNPRVLEHINRRTAVLQSAD